MMLSSTVMPRKSAMFWKVRAIPCRAASWGSTLRFLRPLKATVPRCGWYTPLMTLSIEDLPAPFGPMMARISCSRTSNETPCKATTPPKASEMSSIWRMTAPIVLPVVIARDETGRDSRRLHRRGDTVGLRLQDFQVRRYRAGAAVPEAHLGLDEAARLVRVESIDQRGVFLADVAAAHLARARELAV